MGIDVDCVSAYPIVARCLIHTHIILLIITMVMVWQRRHRDKSVIFITNPIFIRINSILLVDDLSFSFMHHFQFMCVENMIHK